MDIPYMEYKLRELKQKLSDLTETYEYEDYEVKNLDTYFHTETRTRGSKEEISRVKSEIEKLEKEIKEANELVKQRARESKEREEREKIASEEKRKQEAKKAKEKEELEKEMAKMQKRSQRRKFELVKKMYKRGPFLYRVFDKIIPFRGPKWKVIKGYTQEELEFLVKIAKGTTLHQEKQERDYERHHIEFTAKDRKWSNWWAFMAALDSRYKLKQKIEKDEDLKQNPYGIH